MRRIAEEVAAKVKESGANKPARAEGQDDWTWVLLDFGLFVVHVMHEETRQYYDLERLWSDVPMLTWDDRPAA